MITAAADLNGPHVRALLSGLCIEHQAQSCGRLPPPAYLAGQPWVPAQRLFEGVGPPAPVERRGLGEPQWLAWNECTIPKLVQAISAHHAFDRLPVLADALEDAGCTDRAVLDHLRGPGPHVRGCWVLDLLLGKQ